MMVVVLAIIATAVGDVDWNDCCWRKMLSLIAMYDGLRIVIEKSNKVEFLNSPT